MRLYASLFLSVLVVFSGCSFKKSPCQETRVLLGTYVTIKIQDADKTYMVKKAALEAAFKEIGRLEGLLSSFKRGNIIDAINNAGTKEVFLDEDTFCILEKAKYFNKVSGGAFDITVLPLLELWGFHGRNFSVPSADEINQALKRVGSDKMILDASKKSVRFLEPGMKIDLGGIGKGYAVDKAVAVLRKSGIKNAVVSAAGDIYCMGRRSDTKKWSVGIRDPLTKNRIIERLELEDTAVSTSGGYENYFMAGGRRYSHIIDPRTGSPAENNMLSATIIAKDNITADALATAAMVLGNEKALGLVKGLGNAKAIVIIKEGSFVQFPKDKD